MKIYTRTGDTGSTGLFGGPRVSKDDDRIESYGTVDELNAAIGVSRAMGVSAVIDGQLDQIQHALFAIGAELATPDPDAHQMRIISDSHIQELESWIDQHESTVPPLKHFILPAGHPACASLHLARSICRRAERRVVTLSHRLAQDAGDGDGSVSESSEVSEALIVYLNRLSDLLFVLTRVVNHQAGVEEVKWVSPKQS